MIKPHVTKYEWEQYIRPTLAAKGIEQRDRQKMEGYLFAAFDQDRGDDTAGIEADEITEIIAEMKKQKEINHIPLSKIEILEAELEKYLTR